MGRCFRREIGRRHRRGKVIKRSRESEEDIKEEWKMRIRQLLSG